MADRRFYAKAGPFPLLLPLATLILTDIKPLRFEPCPM